MKIKLDDKHYLISETECSWVVCRSKSETGKVWERRVSGYHKTIEGTMASYFQKRISGSESTSIKALRKDIADGLADIHKWCKEIEKEQNDEHKR